MSEPHVPSLGSLTDQLPDDLSGAVHVRLSEAKAAVETAQAALSEASRIQRLWTTMSERLAAGQPVAALLDCRKRLARPEALPASDLELAASLAKALEPVVGREISDLETTLPATFARVGVELDPLSRHPRYTTDRGFVSIKVDIKRLIAIIGTRGGQPAKSPLDVDSVAADVQAVRHRLFERPAPTFSINELSHAYEMVVASLGLREGADIPIRDVHDALKRAGHPLPPDEFNVDLSRLVAQGGDAADRRILLSNTRDVAKGFLLWGMEDAGYVGYLRVEGRSE